MDKVEPTPPWIQTNLGASVFATLLGLFLGSVLNSSLEALSGGLRAIILVGVALVAVVVASAVSRRWRSRLWIPILVWAAGLQPVTAASRTRAVAAAKQAVFDEHAAQEEARLRSPSPPSWVIRHDRRMGRDEFDNDTFWLTNMGFPVKEVEISGNPEFIGFPHRVVFQNHENGIGQWFAANITERGRAEGVTLTISWRNRHGDPGSFDYRLEPDALAEMAIETRDEAFARGKSEGFAAGRDEGNAQGRAELLAELEAKRGIPIRKARWAVVRMPNGSWTLSNTAQGSLAFKVVLDAPSSDFTFFSAADWDEMPGVHSERFEGLIPGVGTHVAFNVAWEDANGAPQTSEVHWHDPALPL